MSTASVSSTWVGSLRQASLHAPSKKFVMVVDGKVTRSVRLSQGPNLHPSRASALISLSGFGGFSIQTTFCQPSQPHLHNYDDVFKNRKSRSFNGARIFGIKCDYPLVRISDSDLRTTAIGLSARVVTALHQGRAIVNRLLDHPPPETCPGAYESACRVPYEIVEMVIAHLARDIRTLKVCSLTCHSWHIAALPHLRHTLTLKGNTHGTTRNELGPLSKLHKLGQIPLVKEIQVKQLCGAGSRGWFAPRAFSHRDLRYFSAFTNVHTLRFKELEIYRFIPDIERYFGHFSPTLRSITLFNPHCTPQQLSYFLSPFSNLDDIEIRRIDIHVPNTTVPNKGPVSFSVPKLRGRLTAHQIYQIEAWTHLITLCSGLRFHYMNLHDVADCVPVLLEACTETLETLRFNATDDSAGK